MARHIRVTEKTEPIIRDTSATEPRLDPDDVAAALGAEPAKEKIAARLGPINLLVVRQELFRRLQSTGGRPALAGTSRRVKIPLSDEQWHRLEALAAEVSAAGPKTTAGQVASVLLALAMEAVAGEEGRR